MLPAACGMRAHREACGGLDVSMTKAKEKCRETAKKSPEGMGPKLRVTTANEPVEMGRVRESIRNLVGSSALVMVAELIRGGGQVAIAKYLFEVVGLYPANEAVAARPEEESVAHALFVRMGLPVEPGTGEDSGTQEASAAKEWQDRE